MPKWCVETFCFLFITILAPQLGSLKFREGEVSCIQQSYWQLWHVATLHGIRRTAKKGSYFPKIAKAIIAKCTGWESWTLKVENQWEVQVGELAWSRAYEHEIFLKFQTEICRNLLRIELVLREDNKKATSWNPKLKDCDCDGITQFLSNYFYPVLFGGVGENKQNNTTTQLSYFAVAWKGHFIISLESRYLLLTAKRLSDLYIKLTDSCCDN